ncbi:MAG: M14 family zinc carboxypeptidase [bacterium]|nr:M14 family zinc carboxypeptidase [bacterium]
MKKIIMAALASVLFTSASSAFAEGLGYILDNNLYYPVQSVSLTEVYADIPGSDISLTESEEYIQASTDPAIETDLYRETDEDAEAADEAAASADTAEFTAEPEPTFIPTASPDVSAITPPNYIILAVQSPLICSNGTITNIWDRPYIYNETTYVPLRKTAECLGASVDYIEDTQTISVSYKGNTYSINANDDKVNIFYGVSFLPLRDMCNYLGVTVNWYDGLITLADDGYILNYQQVNDYKAALEYQGYTDEYFLPRTVVNPRVQYTYEQMNEDIRVLGKMYPDIIRDIHSIGTTSEGRDIPAFYLGKGSKTIVMCASMHARECIATNFLMYMVDSYANAYVNDLTRDGYSFKDTLDNYSFLIVPMVNPDGINIVQNGFDSAKNPEFVKSLPQNSFGSRGWKATAQGVDLNNNFDLMWYSKGSGPSSEGYSGASAASEPETKAMQELINNTDFLIFASFHTQGEVLYWMDPNCNQELSAKHSDIITRICDEIGFTKMPSDGTEGYSGYMTDYVRYYKNTMAMTIELCPYIGDYPYPESDFDTIAYPVRNIGLILADAAEDL